MAILMVTSDIPKYPTFFLFHFLFSYRFYADVLNKLTIIASLYIKKNILE